MIGSMERHESTKDTENPVGPETPLVKLDVPLWQVYVALFLIAMVLTAFKLYERSYIAPHKQVAWQPLKMVEVQERRRQRRDQLIWIHSRDAEVNQTTQQLFEEPSVRAAIYLNRFLAWEIKPEYRNDDLNAWIDKHLQRIADGGVACWTADAKQAVFPGPQEMNAERLVELLEGE